MSDARLVFSRSSNSNPSYTSFEDRLLGEKAVADLLALGLSTVQQWRGKGKGPKFLKLGRLVRYRTSDVLHYIENLKTFSSTCEADEEGRL